MRLIVDHTDSAEPVIPVRWCLDPKDVPQINSVQKGGDQEIAILIVILYEKGGEKRIVTKVDEMMVHLSFDRPGNHTVVACLVSSYDLVTFKKRIQMKDDEESSGYRHVAYDQILGEFSKYIPNGFLISGTKCEIEVAVPKEHFPKKPNKILWTIANYPFAEPARDQCSYRRRLMLGWSLSIILILISILTVLVRLAVATFLTLLGQRNVNWKAVFHPRDFDTEQVSYGVRSGNNWFLCDDLGNKRPWQVRMLNPLLWIVLLVFSLIVHLDGGPSFFRIFAVSAVLIMMFTVSMSILGFLVSKVANLISEAKYVSAKAKESSVQMMPPVGESLYEFLGCHAGKKIEAKVSALPAAKQTVRLRYHELKAQVCRPYAKG